MKSLHLQIITNDHCMHVRDKFKSYVTSDYNKSSSFSPIRDRDVPHQSFLMLSKVGFFWGPDLLSCHIFALNIAPVRFTFFARLVVDNYSASIIINFLLCT